MTTLTLKGLPDDLHDALKRRAKRNRRSLNHEAIACLEQIVAPTQRQASEVLDQIRASRARLTQTGIAPLTDAFLEAAKQDGRP
jgi:plasmid stability protein